MKILFIILITVLYYSLAYSAPPDSLDTNPKKPVIEEAKEIGEKKGEDISRRRGKKDAFIDKDGDGICDQRVKGMSFEKAQRRHMQRNQGSKKGNGNQNGQK